MDAALLWVRYHRVWMQVLDDVGGGCRDANELESEALRAYGCHGGLAEVDAQEARPLLASHVEALEDIAADALAAWGGTLDEDGEEDPA